MIINTATKQHQIIPTLRGRCVVHGVYHVMTVEETLFSTFVTGHIKVAFSLRGPGHFNMFKNVVWNWLVGHYELHPSIEGVRPTADAKAHREDIWSTLFPTARGKRQCKNRLRYWDVWKLPKWRCTVTYIPTLFHPSRLLQTPEGVKAVCVQFPHALGRRSGMSPSTEWESLPILTDSCRRCIDSVM